MCDETRWREELQEKQESTQPDKGGNLKEKSSLELTKFVRMFRADLRHDKVRSARAGALSDSVSSTTCAMRTRLSQLRADCSVSYAKRSIKRMAAALKSCTMSGAGDGWASGREWITVTRGRVGGGDGASGDVVCRWDGASASVGEADVGDAGGDGEVRLIRLGGDRRSGQCDASLLQGGHSIVLDEWEGGKNELVLS